MPENKQTRSKFKHDKNNEDGFVLVLAMLIMIVLIVIGTTAIKGTRTDILIAGNERQQKKIFYVADSAWPDGADWLNALVFAPKLINVASGDNGTVRNPGGVALGDNVTEDGNLNSVPYWYSINELGDKKAVKFGKDYRDFIYTINADADGVTDIDVLVNKVYKVGYN